MLQPLLAPTISSRWLAGSPEIATASRVIVSANRQLRYHPAACAPRHRRQLCIKTCATGKSSSDPERNAADAEGDRTQGDIEHPEGTDASPLTLGAQLQQRMARLKAMDDDRQLLEGPMDAPDVLLEGAILIARHRYPSLDPQQIHNQLDQLAAHVEELLPTDARYPLRIVQTINQVGAAGTAAGGASPACPGRGLRSRTRGDRCGGRCLMLSRDAHGEASWLSCHSQQYHLDGRFLGLDAGIRPLLA